MSGGGSGSVWSSVDALYCRMGIGITIVTLVITAAGIGYGSSPVAIRYRAKNVSRPAGTHTKVSKDTTPCSWVWLRISRMVE